jgi:hypothetical protein
VVAVLLAAEETAGGVSASISPAPATVITNCLLINRT